MNTMIKILKGLLNYVKDSIGDLSDFIPYREFLNPIHLIARMLSMVFLIFYVFLVMAVAVAIVVLPIRYLLGIESTTDKKQFVFDQRVESLSKALGDADKIISRLKTDIENNQHILKRLREDRGNYERLKSMDDDDLRAISTIAFQEARIENQKSFVVGMIANIFFFAFGVIGTILLPPIFRKIRRKRSLSNTK
jgi:ABC-type multidrug transport system fused ATPase/permease subunit